MNRQWPDKHRTALVAGGAGFIGSHLCRELLQQGYRVICVDSLLTGNRLNLRDFGRDSRFSFLEHDVTEPLTLDEPVHAVLNLACAASPPQYQADPVHTLMTSVLGTGNLLQLAERHGARYLQASTSEVYGDPQEHPQREEYWGNVNPTGPRACYDEGKRAGETLCSDMLRQGRVDARVARIFNTYGPAMSPGDGRIVSNFVMQALRGEPLTVYGSGEQTRSFCYVSDLVAGLLALLDVVDNPGGPVNLGNPAEFTVLDLARMVLDLVPSGARIEHHPLPVDDPQRRRPDITRATELLGWRPRVPLAEGLPPTIAWFRSTLEDQHPAPALHAALSAQEPGLKSHVGSM